MQSTKFHYHIWLSAIFIFVFASYTSAQTDSAVSVKNDTAIAAKPDTAVAKKSKEKFHRNDAFILYAGVNFNDLKVSSKVYESVSGTGWHLGVSYKKEGFFYWGIGARLSMAEYNLYEYGATDSVRDKFSVTEVDVPITGGINFLPFSKRVVNFHVFVSAVPSFELSVGDNKLGIDKTNTNTTKLYGQGGLGVDIFSFVVDAGINVGFTDLMKNIESKPNQFFVSLGFRF